MTIEQFKKEVEATRQASKDIKGWRFEKAGVDYKALKNFQNGKNNITLKGYIKIKKVIEKESENNG